MSRKSIFLTGIFTYSVLLLLAAVFYKKRVILFDAGYQLFCIVKNKSFAIQCFRFGSVFIQAFPLLATWFHLSLSIVAMSWSLAFILFYAGCFFVCFYFFRDEKSALILLLFSVMMVSQTFYWMQCELVHGDFIFFVGENKNFSLSNNQK